MAGEGVAMAAWAEAVTLIALCFVLALAAGAHMVWRAAWRSSRMLPVRDIWFWLDAALLTVSVAVARYWMVCKWLEWKVQRM